MFHLQQNIEGRNDLPDREARQCILVTHHQHLTHLNDGLQLARLVPCSLETCQELLGPAHGGGRHASVQDEVVHPGTKNSSQVGRKASRLQHGLETSHVRLLPVLAGTQCGRERQPCTQQGGRDWSPNIS